MKLFAASLGAIVTCLTLIPGAAEASPSAIPVASAQRLSSVDGNEFPPEDSVVTSGLSGLFDLVEEEQFTAHVVLTTTKGVRSLLVSAERPLWEVLETDQSVPQDFVDEKGRPADGKRIITNGETLLLFGSEYENKFERIELKPTTERLESPTLPEGETHVLEEGKPGQALKTVVAVSTLDAPKGSSPKAKRVTTELLTVIVPPIPRRVLVGTATAEDLLASNEPVDPLAPYDGEAPVTVEYPVSGPVTSSFGMRVHPITGIYKLHDGTDFSAGCGTPILAAAKGVVTTASYEGGYGNRVTVDHGGGFSTSYTHLSTFEVEVGDVVDHSKVIGLVGSTGYSTGCHLHFMTMQDGSPLDPMNFLE